MDAVKQAAEQMIASAAAQMGNAAQGARGQKADAGQSRDFDSMVRQKYRKAEKAEEAKQTGEAGKPAQKSGSGAREDNSAVEEQPGIAQQALAAAMMLQQPVVAVEEPIQLQEAVVEAIPEGQAETAAAAAVELQPEQLPDGARSEDEALPQLRQAQPQAAPVIQEEQAQPREAVQAPEQEDVQTVRQEMPDARPRDPAAVETAERKPEQTGRQERGGEAGETEETGDRPVETPVFERADAVPVKVADVQARPVEVNAPDAPEQLAERITVAEQAGMTRVELTLAPEGLGRLTVEITRTQAGALSVVLNTADARTVTALEKHTGNLQQLLSAGAQSEVRVEVRANEEAQRQFMNPDDGQGRQQQQQQSRNRQDREDRAGSQDFVQQLRLGLIDLDGE